MSIDWKRLSELVHAGQRFVLTSHVRPDADALGSELGMAGILEALGKTVMIANPDKPPPNLRFLDPHGKIKVLGIDLQAAEVEKNDIHMILDTSAWCSSAAWARSSVRRRPARFSSIIM